tara:strand:- start:2342 stop:2893 length:552 start_codon:yes stop_codon:yes gene_type:complete
MSTPISELPTNNNDQALFDELLKEIEPASNANNASSSDALYARQMLDTSVNGSPSIGMQTEPSVSFENNQDSQNVNTEVHADLLNKSSVNPNLNEAASNDAEYKASLYGTSGSFGMDWILQVKYAATVACIVFLFCMPTMDYILRQVPKFSSNGILTISAVFCKAFLAGLLFFGIDTMYRMQK